MFTGLVTAVGVVRDVHATDDGLELRIAAPYDDVQRGESIAVDGACLTVTAHDAGGFRVHVVTTSLDRTGFAAYHVGRRVNLERALRVGDRLGGHLVQGHVDGQGTITMRAVRGDATLLDVRVPPDVSAVSARLGSITVDGVSLTINDKPAADVIQVSLIPFTLDHTTLGDRRVGDLVHVEGDLVGKHVRQLMQSSTPETSR